jgi:D-alanyl-D-alanine endopeptidase (penicillin-binding protein 7)
MDKVANRLIEKEIFTLMKPITKILVALTTLAGIAASTLYAPSNANVAPTMPESAPVPSYVSAEDIIQYGQPNRLALQSSVVMVMDDRESVMIYGRNVDRPRPIASLTKLMTALVIVESGLPLDEQIKITREDRDRLRNTRSRLNFNAVYTRLDLLRAALGASDNRAAAALARSYPGGREAMALAMNAKAKELGMIQTHYVDSSGLDNNNISTARDLTRLVAVTSKQPLIHTLTTTPSFQVTDLVSGRQVSYHNTNRLLRRGAWDIGLSKTGYTAAAGNCLLMQTTIANRPLTIVLLDSWGKQSRYGDANRINKWLQKAERRVPPIITASASPTLR